jgi:hypothetical protein
MLLHLFLCSAAVSEKHEAYFYEHMSAAHTENFSSDRKNLIKSTLLFNTVKVKKEYCSKAQAEEMSRIRKYRHVFTKSLPLPE